jgi:hypothetical protein
MSSLTGMGQQEDYAGQKLRKKECIWHKTAYYGPLYPGRTTCQEKFCIELSNLNA